MSKNITSYLYALGALLAAVLFMLGLFSVTGFLPFTPAKDAQTFTTPRRASISSDIQKLSTVKPDFPSIRAFFVDLADKKGAVYAFDVLVQAPLPSNVDTHLLGHAVGDELYKQQGLDGMQYCTHDLRNACSHSVVIGALLTEGPVVFDKVNAVCKNAPGGPGAYTMCFHGCGHGVLAYTDYEVPDAVKLCAKVGTKEYGYEEEYQCIGGIIMEMYQGQHDPATWAQKKEKYLSPDEPLKLCQADYMPEGAKVLCYSYITPYIFDAAGAKGGNPTPDIYTKSFSYCDVVKDSRQRDSCYGGLGKEFIVLAQDRDIRNMEYTPNDKLQLTASWCNLAGKDEAKTSCLSAVVDSLFWGGENDPDVTIRFCSLLTDAAEQASCFTHMFVIADYYQTDAVKRTNICSAVPEQYQTQCTDKLVH